MNAATMTALSAPSPWSRRPMSRPRLRRGRGLSLLEVAVALALAAVVMANLMLLQAQGLQRIKANAVADRLSTIMTAAATYAQTNFNVLAANVGSGLAVPVTSAMGGGPAGLPSIQGSGMLPAGFQATNSFGQTEWLLVRPAASGGLDFLVMTGGGQAISDGDLQWIAAKTGAPGGFVSAMAPYSSSLVTGSYGGWSYNTAYWTVGGVTPAVGHLAASLAFTQGALADYLYRVAVPGHPEANQMFTDIDMSGGGTGPYVNGNGGSTGGSSPGGNSIFGGGGQAVGYDNFSSAQGGPGLAPGAGGGGACNLGGGRGADGAVVVEWWQ